MKKMLNRRSGFTLVELLIVIIIIGILAGAMLLVAGSGTDKAEATKIVSNLRSLKSATLLYYADQIGSATPPIAVPAVASLEPYMDRKADGLGGYSIVQGGTNNTNWYVSYANATGGVATKLAGMAAQDGLFSGSTGADTAYTSGPVFMKPR